jgi:hypothetical protein
MYFICFLPDVQLPFELDRAFGVRVIRSFFALEPNLGLEVIDVEGLTLRLDHPHRNFRFLKMCFVKVEDDVFTGITLIDLRHF